MMTTRRMNRPLVLTGWSVIAAVLPRTWTTVVKLVPLLDTWMSKSRVFWSAPSPPASAWRTVNLVIATWAPRSTVRILLPPTAEHHLSLLPPKTLPLTAFSGPSSELHGVEPVAGRFSARFPLGGTGFGGGAGGGVVGVPGPS